MNLSHDELADIQRHNQRVKALSAGTDEPCTVTITWVRGELKSVNLDMTFLPNFEAKPAKGQTSIGPH